MGMIEPFEPNQVRQSGDGRIISYGTSSYGYDVRCASEFKVFTNINSTIVDPKKFDEKTLELKDQTAIDLIRQQLAGFEKFIRRLGPKD
jgi:deoxycytidine triphosphate deaminase